MRPMAGHVVGCVTKARWRKCKKWQSKNLGIRMLPCVLTTMRKLGLCWSTPRGALRAYRAGLAALPRSRQTGRRRRLKKTHKPKYFEYTTIIHACCLVDEKGKRSVSLSIESQKHALDLLHRYLVRAFDWYRDGSKSATMPDSDTMARQMIQAAIRGKDSDPS